MKLKAGIPFLDFTGPGDNPIILDLLPSTYDDDRVVSPYLTQLCFGKVGRIFQEREKCFNFRFSFQKGAKTPVLFERESKSSPKCKNINIFNL